MPSSKISFQEQSFVHTDAEGREHSFSFQGPLKIRFLPYRKKISIRGKGSRSLLPAEDAGDLPEIFRRWSAANAETARKGAFDYAEDRKGFSRLTIAVCLLFTGPMAVALLNDSWKQSSCTTRLQQEVQPGQIDVTKVKKEKKGQYILKLAFTAPNGQTITGQERWITQDENSIPKSLPIIYSPAEPECWAMTTTGTEISWAKRRYFAAVSGMFGAFFLALTIYGLLWAAGRLLWLPPYREEVLKAAKI